MVTLIVVFITLSLMGSALWIMPPKQERRRMSLRMFARKQNLTVQLTSIELPDKWDKSKEVHKVCSYALYRGKPADLITQNIMLLTYEVWKYHSLSAGWWCNKDLELSEEDQARLQSLAVNVKAIVISRESVAVYWHEAGTEADVEVMGVLLPSLAKCV